MKRRIVVACVGGIALVGSIAVAVARAQQPTAPAAAAVRKADSPRVNRAALRARVARLRAEVELLRLENEAAMAFLKPALTDLLNLESLESAGEETSKIGTTLRTRIRAAGVEPVVSGNIEGLPIPSPEERAGNRRPETTLRIDGASLKVIRPMLDRKKKEFLRRATELNDKTLELAEAETLYLESPLVDAKDSDTENRDDRVQKSVNRSPEAFIEPVAEDSSEDQIPILDPIPGELNKGCCPDPPSEAEIWGRVPKFKNGMPPLFERQRNNVRILTERIGEKVDAANVYPLAGLCQMVHCHYKCTVYYDELLWSDYPIPFSNVDHRVEVVYIDKDYLRRGDGAIEQEKSKSQQAVDPPAIPVALPVSLQQPDATLEARMARVEEKLDLIFKAVNAEKTRPRD